MSTSLSHKSIQASHLVITAAAGKLCWTTRTPAPLAAGEASIMIDLTPFATSKGC